MNLGLMNQPSWGSKKAKDKNSLKKKRVKGYGVPFLKVFKKKNAG